MPDFPPDFIYNGEPCDARYWRYSLRCRVEDEIEDAIESRNRFGSRWVDLMEYAR